MTGKITDIKPLASPFYAPPYTPAWSCKGFQRISVICEADKEAINKLLLNTPFSATGTRIEFFTDNMSGHTLGSFNESGILVPVSYEGVCGLYHGVIFITTDVAMIAGREVFGYPKLLGEVSFEENNGRYIGSTTRKGEEIFHVEFEPNGDLIDVKELLPLSNTWKSEEYEWTHHLLIKSIPSPFLDKPDVLRIIYRNLSAKLSYIQPGNATLTIGTAKEVFPTRNAKVVAAYLIKGDFGAGFNEDRRILASL